MGLKGVLVVLAALIMISLLFFYFVPLNTLRFISAPENNNFSLFQLDGNMQFYPNMRYASNNISYKISDCTLQKENNMMDAFSIIENLTSLKFSPVLSNEEISITCQETNRFENDMFVAGEGGATKIVQSRNFNIILNGEILLIRNSECPRPNVAMHELFHALGFEHSSNPSNLMYNVTDCDQTISEDIIARINELYSTPSEPDLTVENVSAVMKGRFLSVNLSVINGGLKKAGDSKIVIYADKNDVKEIDVPALEIGQGELISLENIFVSQLSVNEITVSAETSFSEIDKENNKVKLEIKSD
jgi:hypothetical protein